MATLESLEIEVKHSASGAAEELNAVATAISKISGALTRALPKLGKLAEALGKIGSPVTINDIHDSNFTKVVENAKKAASTAASTANATDSAETKPLEQGLVNEIATADKLQIAIKKCKDAANEFRDAVKNGDATAAWKAQEKYVNAAGQALREQEKVANAAAKAEAQAKREQEQAAKAAAKAEAEAAKEAARAEAEAAKNAAPTPVPFEMAQIIENASEIDVLTAKLERLKVALHDAFASGDTDKAYDLQGKILQVQSALDRATEAANRSKEAMKGAAQGTREMSHAAEKAQSPLGNFISSLKRIAFYRFIRTIIKEITQAFQEGLKNAYAFSSGIEGESHRFAAAMDSMKSAGGTMKNQLGAAFIGLLAAIAPVVNAIIGLITRLAAALSQLFGAFTGGTWLRATSGAQDLADACGGGAAAAEEWKNQLMGFDEINRLEDPGDGGGGGGGGGGALNGMFEEAELTGIFAKIREKWLELINELDFEPLKKAWEDLKKSLERFAQVVEQRIGFVWETYLKPLAHWTIEEGLPLLIEDIAAAFELWATAAEKLEPYIEDLETHFIVPFMEWDFDRVSEGLRGVGEALQTITDALNGDISLSTFADNFTGAIQKVSEWLNPFLKLGRETGEFFGEELGVLLQQTVQDFQDLWNDIKTGWEDFVKWIEEKWNDLKEWWSTRVLPKWNIRVPSIEIHWEEAGELLKFFGYSRVPRLSVSWNSFATGGFPEDGLFMANHGELVGKFSNGKTAVANNEQIIEGIKQGVIEAMTISNSGSSNGGTRIAILQVNGREFCRAVFEDSNAVANEHGVSLITV